MAKIGFGGSCHWCTEAIFQSLKGVVDVQQGWIAAYNNEAFSEAVIVGYDFKLISLETLIAIHLHTHSSTAKHAMREKYRSAVYTFNDVQADLAKHAIHELQPEFANTIITQVMPFKAFRLNQEQYLNYYQSNPQKPFCKNIISPKLKLLIAQFGNNVKPIAPLS